MLLTFVRHVIDTCGWLCHLYSIFTYAWKHPATPPRARTHTHTLPFSSVLFCFSCCLHFCGLIGKLPNTPCRHWKEYYEYQRTVNAFYEEQHGIEHQYQQSYEQLEKLKKTNVFNDAFHIWSVFVWCLASPQDRRAISTFHLS